MATLGDIPDIKHSITKGNLKAVKSLHIIAFGNEGVPRQIRKALRAFSGFNFGKNCDEYLAKIENVKIQLQLADLIAVCHILNLDYSGTVHDVAGRICSFLTNFDVEDVDDEDVEDVDDEDVEEDEEYDNEEEERGLDGARRHNIVQSNDSIIGNNSNCFGESIKHGVFSLTFRDVEDSIRSFDGKDEYPVRKWISDFEEVASVTGWNELQKLIFAKKLLTGLAKLYIQSESGITTWSILRKRLIEEFDVKVSSAQVHKLLMNRRKKREESVQEYVLTMREIGSRVNLEPEVVIQYIIDGIQDDSSHKIVLYGARNFQQFKEKVKLYESIQKKKPISLQSSVQSQSAFKVKKEVRNEDANKYKGKIEVCFNCGEKGHKSRGCPHKSKGTKCFSCSGFGHVSTKCPKKTTLDRDQPSTSADLNVLEVIPRNALKLKMGNVQLLALFDTGSDICTVREDVYRSFFHDVQLDENSINVKGLGGTKIATIGSFTKDVVIGDEDFCLTFHVIPSNATSFKVIIGNSILAHAEVCIKDEGIRVYKKEKINWLMEIAADKDVSDEVALNLGHIRNLVQRREVGQLIQEYKPEKTKTTDIEMKIILKNEEPVYHRPRRLSISEKEVVENQIEEWLQEGIIRPSSSDFASPIVLVKKKDGRTRICCDYRKLNRNIVKDRFPLPLVEDVLDRLENGNYFTTIDLRNGFFHVSVEENSRKYTAFVTHNGQYEFLKCPFGLCNSPAVFQRFIHHVFRELTMKNIAIYYMDDVIIPSSTELEGIQRLKMVLEIARDYGLEIKKEKCQLLKRRVAFLGFIIQDGKIQPSEEKTAAIRKFPVPSTCKQVQSFLGLTGYFRKFISSYAIIAKPLSDLLKNNHPFIFGESQRTAFDQLKKMLTCEPVLHIYQRGCETELHTDASRFGYGACLLQKSDIDSKFHPVYYMRKKTTPAEEKYSSYELEVLAIIAAVKKFRVYLLGISFKIVTDCQAFQKTMEKKDLTTRVARWALLLEEYDYTIDHRKGTRMLHVDALSRYPMVMTMIEEDGLLKRIQSAQNNDDHLLAVKKILNSEGNYEDYLMKHDILYKYDNGREVVVIPKAMQNGIIKMAHETAHFSVKKTEELIRREFYMPKMKEKIENIIRNCIPCILGNRKEGKKEGELHPLPKQEGPLHTYHADHLGPIPSTNKNYQYIFAVIDGFSKFTWLYPTKSTTAKETISCLSKQQKIFGNPVRIITDRGTAFTANDFKEYCRAENIDHVTVTTGVPRGNGQVERIHRTVIPVLTKLSIEDPTKWYKFIDRVQRALNSTYQRSVATTPFEVLVGIKMRNKEDIRIQELIEQEAVKNFCENREQLRIESKQQILKVQAENRRGYNLRRKKATAYNEGDLVAIKRTQFGTGLKVNRKFLGPYEVIACKANERYDVVKVGHHDGPMRTSTCAEFMKSWITDDSESEADSL